MTQEENWEKVDDYLSRRLAPSDDVLDLALRSAAEAGLPAINVSPGQGKLLNLLVRMCGARRILEVGTLAGYSTIWMARALAPGGSLVTLELDARHAQIACQNLESAGLGDIVEVRVGKAVDTLDSLIESGAEPFDFIFLDADKENNAAYLERSLALSHQGTVIVGDNVVRRGRVADITDTESDVLGVRAFLDLMSGHPRLDSTAIQTVGCKGWDGFSISVVKA